MEEGERKWSEAEAMSEGGSRAGEEMMAPPVKGAEVEAGDRRKGGKGKTAAGMQREEVAEGTVSAGKGGGTTATYPIERGGMDAGCATIKEDTL